MSDRRQRSDSCTRLCLNGQNVNDSYKKLIIWTSFLIKTNTFLCLVLHNFESTAVGVQLYMYLCYATFTAGCVCVCIRVSARPSTCHAN